MNDQDVTVTINFEDPVFSKRLPLMGGRDGCFSRFYLREPSGQFIETPRSGLNAFVQDEARKAVG